MYLKEKIRDSASSTYTALLALSIMFMLVLTSVDGFAYMGTSAAIQNVAASGARTVSIFGGNGTSTVSTPLERAYGIEKSRACSTAAIPPSGNVRRSTAINSETTTTECQVMSSLSTHPGLVLSEIREVKCGPYLTTHIGQETYCTVKWTYNSVVGKLSIMNFSTSESKIGTETLKVHTSKSTDVSEVKFESKDVVGRLV